MIMKLIQTSCFVECRTGFREPKKGVRRHYCTIWIVMDGHYMFGYPYRVHVWYIYSNIGGILMVNGVQVEIVLQVQYWMVNTKHCNIKWLKWLRSLRSIILIPIWMINRLFQVCSHVEAKAASAFFRTLHPLWRLSRWRDGSDQVNHHLGAAQLWSRRNITAGHPPDAPWCWNMHTNIYPNKITQM